MNRLSVRLGFWSAFSVTVAFLVFTVCFVAIPLTSPVFIWKDLAGYVAYVSNNNQFFQNLARLAMLLFGPLFVILLNCIHDYASPDRRLLVRISLCFGVAFAALTGINYFIQLSAVRQNISLGELQGLEQLVQANPYSAVAAINLLGWSLFLGLASLFVAPVFSGSKLEKLISVAFWLNGIFCILGGIGYILNNTVLIFWTLNFGMGGAILLAAIALCLLFKRIERQKRF
jgi:hypothetical protein